jgi:hypothetical protein
MSILFNKKSLLFVTILGGFLCYFTILSNPWETLCPGTQSHSLTTVDKKLAGKVEKILSTLKSEGFNATISSTHRSPEKQQCYYNISKVIQKHTGQKGLTTTTQSCHNHMESGEPAALAVDIHYFSGSLDDKVKFYQRLRTLIREEGLVSGGDFSKSNPVWAKYGLGWDPGHIQTRDCKQRLSRK